MLGLETCTELTPQAVAGVHEHGIGVDGGSRLQGSRDGFNTVVAVNGLGKSVGDIVGRRERGGGIRSYLPGDVYR